MNHAQKNAWFGLGFCLVGDFLIAMGCYVSFTFPTRSKIFAGLALAMLAFVGLLLSSLIIRKRQAGEIETDERDKQIVTLAIRISFAAVWLLLLLTNVLTISFCGPAGPVPAVLFAFFHLWAFIIAATIYFISILVMYRFPGRLPCG